MLQPVFLIIFVQELYHWQVYEGTYGAISILGLKGKGHRYGFSHHIPHYGHTKHIVINHNDTKARH